jgi:hypothetical protein
MNCSYSRPHPKEVASITPSAALSNLARVQSQFGDSWRECDDETKYNNNKNTSRKDLNMAQAMGMAPATGCRERWV